MKDWQDSLNLLGDAFTDIRLQEAQAIAQARAEISSLNAQLDLIRRASALHHAPGWTDFIKAVEDGLERVTADVVSTTKSNEYMRQQQGRAQGLRDVLTIMRGSASLVEHLGQRLAAAELHLKDLLARMPRQREVKA